MVDGASQSAIPVQAPPGERRDLRTRNRKGEPEEVLTIVWRPMFQVGLSGGEEYE